MPPEPQPQVTSSPGPPSWMAPLTPIIPDHELVRRIGGGSYGDVWLARTTVGTWRAVKVVFRDRFTDARPYEREFKGIQKFEPLSRSNEGFMDILQIGRNETQGYFYYVMELADDAGETQNSEGRMEKEVSPSGSQPDSALILPPAYIPKTLARVLLQRGRLPLSECLELGLTLNLGLAHLHRAGLIHRDIKPSNLIFIGGVPKLADIGLVIETTEARSYVGTEGFIPPEGPNSPQADLYSLGKVLYEAGMGKDRKDFPEPFTQIIDAPDSKPLLEFNAILLKACAANVKERYHSAEEMNADLALLQSGGSVRRQRKLAGQLRFVQRAAAIVTALAAVIALGWWWQAKQTRAVRDLAAEKSQLADENRQRIVRLDVANGVRLLDEDDPAGALLWFADALPLVANNPAEESIHRIRIQQTLNQTPQLLQVFPHSNTVSSFSFSQDGQRIVTGAKWGELQVWDARTGEALMKPQALDVDRVWQTRFTRDGHRVFASSLREHGFVEGYFRPTNIAAVIEVGTGRQVASLSGTNLVRADLSPDERWLVTADTDHVIRVHDARDGGPVADLKGHTDRILMFSFSTNGNVLASSSQDRTVRLWRLPSGEPIGMPIQFARMRGPVTLSQDGRLLATADLGSDAGTN
ncbi:MAG: protein kinase, partial [Verrucomicrobia bacterium]|nr:protein kinase [Verrucomicrobiota bacterium]